MAIAKIMAISGDMNVSTLYTLKTREVNFKILKVTDSEYIRIRKRCR